MRINAWMPAACLVCFAAATAVIDGCSDDGIGVVPSNLYGFGNRDGSTGDPSSVSTENTPGENVPKDSGSIVDAQPDRRTNPNPGTPDTGNPMPDTGTPDAGNPMDAADEG